MASASPRCCYVYLGEVEGVVRYVGQGRAHRIRRHLREMRRPENSRSVLYRNLVAAVDRGAEVKFYKIAENLTAEEALLIERIEIASRPREELWNMVPGRRPKITDEERRSNMSTASKRKWADPDHRAMMLVALKSPERNRKISETAKENMRNSGRRMALSDFANAARAAARADPSYPGRIAADPTMVSARFRALWADPEYREKMLAIKTDPERRARASAKQQANWKDPEYRERLLASSPILKKRRSD